VTQLYGVARTTSYVQQLARAGYLMPEVLKKRY
jgi:hypothetical protein